MNNEKVIKNAAHCFRTDEKTIENFIHNFFSAKDIDDAMRVMDKFLDAHANSTTPEELDDFCCFLERNRDKIL
jgi:UDP-galactopyranose mutase